MELKGRMEAPDYKLTTGELVVIEGDLGSLIIRLKKLIRIQLLLASRLPIPAIKTMNF
jgi:hypothetical protein